MGTLFSRHAQKDRRQQHRGDMPTAETLLWSILKGRQILGCKFRRQYSVGPYSIDFFSAEIDLAIELDGDSHFQPGAKAADQDRQQFIEATGIRVVRFLNEDVYDNLDGACEVIVREVQARLRTREAGRRVRRGKKVEGGSNDAQPPPAPP